jgi:glycosyltransferase involved in cell wall biosynthesis
VGSVGEVLLDGVSGFLTNLDSNVIAEKIEFLVNNPKLRVEMGVAGFNFAREKFSPRRLVSDHERLYKELIPSPANF